MGGTPRTPTEVRSEDGFVLVGVVMFVLALTILGLSLFGLSGFEAQFLGNSLNEAQAFYAARGALDRAQFALIATSDLQSVKQDLPANVIYSRARRHDAPWDSTSTFSFEDPDLTLEIRTVGQVGNARSMLEAHFKPYLVRNVYKRLVTSYDSVEVGTTGVADGSPRAAQTILVGGSWQNDPAVGWRLLAPPGGPAPRVGGVPEPDVVSYLASHWDAATELIPVANGHHFNMTGSPQGTFFKSTYTGGDYSVHPDPAPPENQISVTGTCIWLIDRGIRFEDEVEVIGSPTARLIIVARPNTTSADREAARTGIWFFGGLKTTGLVPVILVSDARVVIEQENNADASTAVGYLSIYAGDVFFKGPSPGHAMTLTHAPSELEFDSIIDPLYDLRILPNSDAGAGKGFHLVSGTWREITDSNPN